MLHWRRIKVYARSVWDVIIIITAFCLANDGHLLFSAQWLQKPLGGSWWEVLTRGWLIYWVPSSPSSPNTELDMGFACFPPVSSSPPLFIPVISHSSFSLDSMSIPLSPLSSSTPFNPPLLFSLLPFTIFIQGHLRCIWKLLYHRGKSVRGEA